jgi:hypothetical protein
MHISRQNTTDYQFDQVCFGLCPSGGLASKLDRQWRFQSQLALQASQTFDLLRLLRPVTVSVIRSLHIARESADTNQIKLSSLQEVARTITDSRL